jgi:hypothetical protein
MNLLWPSSTNPVLEPGLVPTSKDYMCCCCNPKQLYKGIRIDVFITKVNTIEDQYVCDSYSLPAIVGLRLLYGAKWKNYSTLFRIYYYVTLCLSMLRIYSRVLF